MASQTTTQTSRYRALRAPGLFAVHCQVSAHGIEVGALLVEPETFEEVSGANLTLYDIDSPASFPVKIPALTAFCTTQMELKRHGEAISV